MKKFQKSLLALSCMTVLSHHSAQAAPPIAFDAWSASKGSVSANCPSRFVCDAQVNGDGMMQRMIIDDQGKRYYQTIVFDKMADGTTMSSESFVMGGNGTDGISTRQVVDVPGINTMYLETTINSGWASSSGATETSITQNITSSEISGVGFSNDFFYESTQDASENVTGYYMGIRQEVLNSTRVGGDVSASGQDKHVFVLRQAKGDRVRSGSINVPSSAAGMGGMGGMGGGGGPTGGTVSWRVGDEVQAIYIGQICQGCETGGMMGGGGGGGGMGGGGGGGGGGDGAFAYNAFDNLSDSSAAAATRDYTSNSNIVWTSQPFGTVPKF